MVDISVFVSYRPDFRGMVFFFGKVLTNIAEPLILRLFNGNLGVIVL